MFTPKSSQQLKIAVDACVGRRAGFSKYCAMNTQTKFFNAIVAVNKLHGIGVSKSMTLPWKLKNEFRYVLGMLDHHQEKFEKQGER